MWSRLWMRQIRLLPTVVAASRFRAGSAEGRVSHAVTRADFLWIARVADRDGRPQVSGGAGEVDPLRFEVARRTGAGFHPPDCRPGALTPHVGHHTMCIQQTYTMYEYRTAFTLEADQDDKP